MAKHIVTHFRKEIFFEICELLIFSSKYYNPYDIGFFFHDEEISFCPIESLHLDFSLEFSLLS